MNPSGLGGRHANSIKGGWCALFALMVAIAVAGCSSADSKWPASGIGGFCNGDESLAVGLEADRTALQLKRKGETEHAPEIRKLRDKAQCIFAAHAERGKINGMYYLALTFLAQRRGGGSTNWRQPPDAERRAMRFLKNTALKGHGPAFIRSLEIPAQRGSGLDEWIKEAASAGNIEAQYELSKAHIGNRSRPGIPRDAKAAEKWLTRAAERGHVFAASALGDLYARGAPGVAQDLRKGDPLAGTAA